MMECYTKNKLTRIQPLLLCLLLLLFIVSIFGCSLIFKDYCTIYNQWDLDNPCAIEIYDDIIAVKSGDYEIFLINTSEIDNNPDVLQKICVDSSVYTIADMSISNNILVLAASMSLFVIDINNTPNPVILSENNMPGNISACHIYEDTIFVSINNNGMHAYLLNGDGTITLICKSNDYNNALKILYSDSHLFFSDIYGRFSIIKIDDQSQWKDIYQFDSEYAYDICDFIIDSNILYIASKSIGARIINISDKENPVEINFSILNPNTGRHIEKIENILIISTISSVKYVNISNINNPIVISEYMASSTINGLCVHNNYILLSLQEENSILILE